MEGDLLMERGFEGAEVEVEADCGGEGLDGDKVERCCCCCCCWVWGERAAAVVVVVGVEVVVGPALRAA